MSSVTIARVKAALNESTGPFELALQAVLILNIGDAVLTSWWVATGWATEANPLMNRVLEFGIGPFLFTKAMVGMFAVVVLKAHKHRLVSKIGLAAILMAYLAVLGIHLSHGAHRLSEGTMVASIDGEQFDFSGR